MSSWSVKTLGDSVVGSAREDVLGDDVGVVLPAVGDAVHVGFCTQFLVSRCIWIPSFL
ncbi:hypothetical protein [Pseudarthrobacter sp. NPDC080039]|uniref:hypothetical protein n=1 Tax=unclassified Pseudarthrobacter TaxID=2647000 RepID=UPI003450E946